MPTRTPLHLQARLSTFKTKSGYLLPKTYMIMRPHVFSLSYYDHEPQSLRKRATRSDKNRNIHVPDPKALQYPPSLQRMLYKV